MASEDQTQNIPEHSNEHTEPMIGRRNALKAGGFAAATALTGGAAAVASQTDEGQDIINQLLGGGPGTGTGGNNTETPTDTPEETPTETPTEVPDQFVLDFRPVGEPVDSNIFHYDTNEEYAQREIDLHAKKQWHFNDYQHFLKQYPEMDAFLNAIPQGTNYTGKHEEEITTAMTEPGTEVYPNNEGYQQPGHYNAEAVKDAETVEEAMGWLHPFLFNFESEMGNGPISTQDERYAAKLQETFQETLDDHTDVDAHVWAFKLPRRARDTHGNGLIYDWKTEELRIMETITNPETRDTGIEGLEDPQLHPRIEDSNYLKEDHEAYNEWWHPLRFDGSAPDFNGIDFETAKRRTAGMFISMASGPNNIENGISSASLTTEYLTDVVEILHSHSKSEMEELYNQARTYLSLANDEGNYVVAGDVDEPYVIQGDSFNHDAVWQDEAGRFDEIYDEAKAA